MCGHEKKHWKPAAVYFAGVTALCAAIFFFTLYALPPSWQISAVAYVPIHTILELASVIVSFLVFAVGWHGYKQTGNRRDLVIAVCYLVVGSVDFFHTLAYKGMPDFLFHENTVGGAAAYWLVARLIDAVALLGAAFVLPRSRSLLLTPTFLLAAALALVGATVVLFTLFHDQVSLLMFVPGAERPLTDLKIGLEYLAIALYVAAFFAYGRSRGWTEQSVRALQTALVVAVFSEICFTLYLSPYSPVNLLGHIFKVIAYYFVFRALFVSSLVRPYAELSRAKEEAAQHVLELEKSLTLIGHALAVSLDRDETLELIADLAAEITHAPITVVAETRDGYLRPLASRGLELRKDDAILISNCAARAAVEKGTVIRLNDLDAHPHLCRPALEAEGVRSLLACPIIDQGKVLGLISVYSPDPSAFGEREERLLQAFAQHASVAIRNAEDYQKQRHIADTLQRNLMLDVRESVVGFELATKYAPAFDEANVGGDFYDVFDLQDEKVGIVIGDVSGKGLSAAVHTSMVKYALRAYASEHSSPAAVLRQLDHTASAQLESNLFITLIYAVLDPKTGEVIYSSAGHENPVLYRSSSAAVEVLGDGGPAIGVSLIDMLTERRTVLEQGDVLMFYTDGITESRRNGALFGEAGVLAGLKDHANANPKELVENVFQRAELFAGGRLADDVAIIAVKRVGQTGA